MEDQSVQNIYMHPSGGCHECEVLGSGSEGAESEYRWKECKKNPGHIGFISGQDFIDSYISRVQTVGERDRLRSVMDLTVRLRVHWTSPDRPDGYPFSDLRRSDGTRLGTGFISDVEGPVSNELCPCDQCEKKTMRKFWRFEVWTARHVVFNTEEAKTTRVDMFFDNHDCSQSNGRMKSVRGVEVARSYPDRDVCEMLCATHDEALAERIISSWHCWLSGEPQPLDLSGLGLPRSNPVDCPQVLIISHPHGQPKKITVGKSTGGEVHQVEYNAATCPGSSGAAVLRFVTHPADDDSPLWIIPVHCGGYTKTSTQHQDEQNLFTRVFQKLIGIKSKPDQLNYGNWWWVLKN